MENFSEVKKKLYKMVEETILSSKNKFSDTAWKHHILPVIKYCLILGRKMKADLEVLELAALLHDYACFESASFYKEHHIHGSRLAEKFLVKMNVPKDKIQLIKDCIMSHRGSVKIKKKTLEAKILASADAMSHISELADMLHLAYGIYHYKTEEGVKWLQGKLKRSWAKIMPEGKNMVRKDYQTAMKILKKALEK